MATRASEALPGFGFFGGSSKNSLELDVNSEIDEVCLSIDGPAPEYLNFGAVRFFSATKKEIPRDALCASVLATSISGGRPVSELLDSFLKGRMVHTEKESKPAVRILFKSATYVSRVIVANRNDEWGVRSRHMIVRGLLAGEARFNWNNIDEARLAKCFEELSERFRDTAHPESDPAECPPDQAGEVLRRALARVVTDGKAGSGTDWRDAIVCLDLYGAKCQLSDDGYTILAYYTLFLMGSGDSLQTSELSPFSRILATTTSIGRLIERINQVASIYRSAGNNFVISKHSLNASRLMLKREGYLNALDQVFELLKTSGCLGMLCYGSLLGAVRSGDFIVHDDDADVLYFDNSGSNREAFDRSALLVEVFKAQGYSFWRFPGSLNFSVGKDGIAIDLFPCWAEADQIHVMMERYQIRPIDLGIVVGAVGGDQTTVKLCGRTYPAPNQPEQFLIERYGAGWSTPDQFHEWPWKLGDA